MTAEDYQQQITLRIKDNLNQWLAKLQAEKPELLLTRQWQVLFPEGFKPGFNCLPVVTNARPGKHLVAEVEFVLPESLELDLDSLELHLKDEPYPESKRSIPRPVLLDTSLDTLNNMIIGLNEFLQGFKPLFPPTAAHAPTAPFIPAAQVRPTASKPGMIKPDPVRLTNATDIDAVCRQLLQSADLPEWFQTIASREIREQLLQKIAETLLHYRQQIGREVDLADFFKQYTSQLLKAGRLQHYCQYKAQVIQLDEEGWCREHYCSKKPYRKACPQVTLRFGLESIKPS